MNESHPPLSPPVRRSGLFRRSRLIRLTVVVAVAWSATGHAQVHVPPGDDGRVLRVFDLRELRRDLGTETVVDNAESTQHVAAALRHFVDPPLRDGDDLVALGNHRLVVLADVERVGSVSRLFDEAERRRNELLVIRMHLFDVDARGFADHLAGELVRFENGDEITYRNVFDGAAARTILETTTRTATTTLAAPVVTAGPLQRVHLAVIDQTPYVRDFTIRRVGDTVLADPVVDVVWAGHQAEACATFLPSGRIGLECTVTHQELEQPIAEVETRPLPVGEPLTIQLPRTTGIRLHNVAELGTESLVVLAARRLDGDYVIAAISVRTQ